MGKYQDLRRFSKVNEQASLPRRYMSISRRVVTQWSTFCLSLIFAMAAMAMTGTAFAAEVQHTIRIDGISCPFCVATSVKDLQAIAGVSKTKPNLKDGTITICADDSVTFTDEQLTTIFKEKGFTYKGMETSATCNL